MPLMSGIFRRGVITVSEGCRELRLFALVPVALPETSWPPLDPGSSVMPGGVNPVVPEVMDMGGFESSGNVVSNEGWRTFLNYVGGRYVYVQLGYASRFKALESS